MAISLASNNGLRSGTRQIPVPSLIFVVVAETRFTNVRTRRKRKGSPGGGLPDSMGEEIYGLYGQVGQQALFDSALIWELYL